MAPAFADFRALPAHRRLGLALAVFALAALLPAARALGELPETLRSALAERIEQEMLEQKIVGLSATFVIDGQVAGTLHFGWADREEQIRPTDETLYRWASISKPLTAVAAMQLVEQGKLDLERDVRQYVPEFPEKPWVITSLQLLCHQGGIVHYTNGEVIGTEREYEEEHPFTCAITTLDHFNRSPLVCQPGTAYAYTTHGYLLLAAAIERAGGELYPQQILRRIIQPLGMTTLQPDYEWIDIPNRAAGYRPSRAGDMIASADVDVSWKLGGGGWISNITDLALFGAGMLDDSLVSPETRQRMFTPQPLADGSATTYGLGFQVRRMDGQTYVEHGGSQQKTRTRLLICPESRVAVALMCNTEGTNLGQLGPDLLRLLRQETAAGE